LTLIIIPAGRGDDQPLRPITLEGRTMTLKELNTEADELACMLCEIEGGDALVERTIQRNDVFRFVRRLPRFKGRTRDAAVRETLASRSS
jgi:hypothetical protein